MPRRVTEQEMGMWAQSNSQVFFDWDGLVVAGLGFGAGVGFGVGFTGITVVIKRLAYVSVEHKLYISYPHFL